MMVEPRSSASLNRTERRRVGLDSVVVDFKVRLAGSIAGPREPPNYRAGERKDSVGPRRNRNLWANSARIGFVRCPPGRFKEDTAQQPSVALARHPTLRQKLFIW